MRFKSLAVQLSHSMAYSSDTAWKGARGEAGGGGGYERGVGGRGGGYERGGGGIRCGGDVVDL